MSERLVCAKDVAQATEYLFSESVHHDGTRTIGRRYVAKCVYWQALREVGYSSVEIARMVGANHSTIINGWSHDVDFDLVTGVLDRAREQIGLEAAS